MPEVTERLSTALADRYRIERHLGEGGMATVYLAEDLKHKRKVAVKVLRPELAAVLGAERFVQEITTTASLQHPNILPLFDSGEADSFLYYVMPFIDGETLRDKLNRETQLGIDEAVGITTDIAGALHYAHGEGVIHRDIKPENILIHNGRPMVADFGIALAVSAAAGGRMTETGLSLGTPHYMSPEQATAEKDLTHRSDIYSLGSVLYEMLTGEPPHVGGSAQAIIMKIVTEPADPVTKIRKSVPPHVAAATAKSLEKLAADRFESAAKFAEALTNPAFTLPTTQAAMAGGVPASGPWNRVSVGLAAVAGLLAVVALWGWLRPVEDPRNLLVSSMIEMPAGHELQARGGQSLAFSPDGSTIVFQARRSATDLADGQPDAELFIRQLGGRPRPIPGTAGGTRPFFSPDGQSIGFFVNRELLTVSVADGQVRTISRNAHAGSTASWGPDDLILFVSNSGLVQIGAEGGTPKVIVPLKSVPEPQHPHILPGGKTALLQLGVFSQSALISVVSLESGEVTHLNVFGSKPQYVDGGFITYLTHGGVLQAIAFDPVQLEILGEPRIIDEDVAQFAVSRNGTIVTALGWTLPQTAGGELVWVERDGIVEPFDSTWTGTFTHLSISPDGERVAVARHEQFDVQIWISDLSSGTRFPLTTDGNLNFRPSWTPDGRYVTYSSDRGGGNHNLYRIRAELGSQADLLHDRDAPIFESASSPDGQWLVAREGNAGVGNVAIIGFHEGTDTAEVLVSLPRGGSGVSLSPDGRYLAYNSEGRVVVRSFPNTDSLVVQVSSDGSSLPMWADNGRELFYLRSNAIVTVEFVTEPKFTTVRERVLPTSMSLHRGAGATAWDVSPDDERFLVIRETPPTGPTAQTLTLTQNFFEELKAKVGN